jgi:hypothetical protein
MLSVKWKIKILQNLKGKDEKKNQLKKNYLFKLFIFIYNKQKYDFFFN